MLNTKSKKKTKRQSSKKRKLPFLPKLTKSEMNHIKKYINPKYQTEKELMWRKRLSKATPDVKQQTYNHLWKSFKKGKYNKKRISKLKNTKKKKKQENGREKSLNGCMHEKQDMNYLINIFQNK